MGFINAINGFEGRVELVGARAVAAMFERWSLRRQGSGGNAWSLDAVVSYQKDVLLKHPKFRRRVLIKEHVSGRWYELKLPDGQEPVIKDGKLIIEGAELCRVDQTGRP